MQIAALSGENKEANLVTSEARIARVELDGWNFVGVLIVLVEKEGGEAVKDKLVIFVQIFITFFIER